MHFTDHITIKHIYSSVVCEDWTIFVIIATVALYLYDGYIICDWRRAGKLATYELFTENAAYQSLAALKTNRNKRHKTRSFFVEGVRNINAAERFGWHFNAFMYGGGTILSNWAKDILSRHKDADFYALAPGLMNKLSSKTDSSEIVAIIRMRNDADAFPAGGPQNANPVYVLFDRPSGKGNLGAVIRSCDAFGVKALYRTGHSVDFYDPEVIASSVGSFFAAPFYALEQSGDVDRLISALRHIHPGIQIIGTSAHGERRVFEADLTGPLLFLIGNETDGLSWRLKQISDIVVAIPMSGGSFASSLNVSCAATALLYEAYRQRSSMK